MADNDSTATLPVNNDQIKNLFKFIDGTQDESVKESIFSRLGSECFFANGSDKWLEQFRGNPQAFFDEVNIEQKSHYWEKLEYTPDRSAVILTGRIVKTCACPYACGSQSPRSLCEYCCKNFQREWFRKLLGRDVDVTITESYLKGDERCSTVIRLL